METCCLYWVNDQYCLMPMLHAAAATGVMVQGIFSWQTIILIKHCLNATANSIVVDHVLLLMDPVYHVIMASPNYKAHAISSWLQQTWQWVACIPLTTIRSQSNGVPLDQWLCDVIMSAGTWILAESFQHLIEEFRLLSGQNNRILPIRKWPLSLLLSLLVYKRMKRYRQ